MIWPCLKQGYPIRVDKLGNIPSVFAVIAKWNKDLFANRNLPFSTTGGPFEL